MAFDATRYDALLTDEDDNEYGLFYYEGEGAKRQTQSVPLRPVRQDTGANPWETRLNSGDTAAQGDWSYGSGQEKFHTPKSDPSMFYLSDGFDISQPNKLTHLNGMALAHASATGDIIVFNNFPFFAAGNRVRSGNGLFPGTWTEENPHNGEGDQNIQDLATDGNYLYAALGANGIHFRTTAGVWDHFQPDGATDLVAGTAAVRVQYLKSRLMVISQVGSSFALFEVAGDSTPTAIETYPVGWTVGTPFEAGRYIYVPVYNSNAGRCVIYHYGLNSGGSALEAKGTTNMPDGQIIHHGLGYVGAIYLVGERTNPAGGSNPIVYRAEASDDGSLNYAKLAEGDGVPTDTNNLPSYTAKARGETVLFPWGLAATADTAGPRAGLAIHHLGRNAFAFDLAASISNIGLVQDIAIYKDRVLAVAQMPAGGSGLYYETTGTPCASAYVISSCFDWHNAALKTWSKIEIQHLPLDTGCSVAVMYSLKHPDENDWVLVGYSNTVGSTGKSFDLESVTSREFYLCLVSTASGANAPTITGYSVRSDPFLEEPEYNLTRYLRIAKSDRLGLRSQPKHQQPVEQRNALIDLLYRYVTLEEPDATWDCRVEAVSEVQPMKPPHKRTQGSDEENYYILSIGLRGTRVA